MHVGDFAFRWVNIVVFHGINLQACSACRVADQIDDHVQTCQGLPLPVHRNMVEQPVFDLIPLARSGRKMTDMNRQTAFIRKFL